MDRPEEPTGRLADEGEIEAPPRAFLPTTPFSDTKPSAGSLVDPTEPRADEPGGADGDPSDR